MALSDRVKTPPTRVQGYPCSIGELLKALPKPEATALQKMLTTTLPNSSQWQWSQSEIYDAIRDEGHTVGRQSINRHRAGKCRCAKARA
jgi:hypothetical protein